MRLLDRDRRAAAKRDLLLKLRARHGLPAPRENSNAGALALSQAEP